MVRVEINLLTGNLFSTNFFKFGFCISYRFPGTAPATR